MPPGPRPRIPPPCSSSRGPASDLLGIGAVFALMNAVMYGSVTVAVRGMTKTELTITLLTRQMVLLPLARWRCLLSAGLAQPGGRGAVLRQWRCQRPCAIFVDEVAAPCADGRRVAVRPSDARLGGPPRTGDRPTASLLVRSRVVGRRWAYPLGQGGARGRSPAGSSKARGLASPAVRLSQAARIRSLAVTGGKAWLCQTS